MLQQEEDRAKFADGLKTAAKVAVGVGIAAALFGLGLGG